MARWVLDECEQIGRDPSTFRFVHYSVLLPGASHEAALRAVPRRGVVDAVEVLGHGGVGIPSAPAARGARVHAPGRGPGHAAGRPSPGSPDELVETLLDIRKQAGVPVEFAARSFLPMIEHQAQLEVMAQLAEGVAPHV